MGSSRVLSATEHLPPNLYRQANGYFYYRHRVAKKNIGIGRDEAAAIEEANRLNKLNISNAEATRRQKIDVAAQNFSVDKHGLVELQFLRENAELYDKVCGIYFLMLDGEVVYIGQSINCHSRISDHKRLEKIQYDSVYILRTDQAALTPLENLYIRKFKPKHNSQALPPTRNTAWGLPQTMKKLPKSAV